MSSRVSARAWLRDNVEDRQRLSWILRGLFQGVRFHERVRANKFEIKEQEQFWEAFEKFLAKHPHSPKGLLQAAKDLSMSGWLNSWPVEGHPLPVRDADKLRRIFGAITMPVMLTNQPMASAIAMMIYANLAGVVLPTPTEAMVAGVALGTESPTVRPQEEAVRLNTWGKRIEAASVIAVEVVSQTPLTPEDFALATQFNFEEFEKERELKKIDIENEEVVEKKAENRGQQADDQQVQAGQKQDAATGNGVPDLKGPVSG
jgi:hypothetical protein